MAVTGIMAKFEGEEPYARARALEPQCAAPKGGNYPPFGVAPEMPDLPAIEPKAVAEQGPDGGAENSANLAELRPVAAITAPLVPGKPPTAVPVFMDVAPTELLIDGSYQRDLSDRGLRLIGRIVEAWDWRRFKPPVCAWTERGLVVIDGQHTAIAAATHGGLATIPVMVVEAKDAKDQASAFVGHNRDRLALAPVQIHTAAVQAGDPDALHLQAICEAAGVSIVRSPHGGRKYKPGETIAIATISSLIRDHGDKGATDMLRILVDGGCAPVAKDHIRAVEELLTKPEYALEINPADLPAAIRKAADTAEKDAKLFAADHATSFWRGLVNVWFRAVKKRRRA